MEFNYITESAKTNNVDTAAILERLSDQNRFIKLMAMLSDYSVICEQLDVFKKALFYGKPESLAAIDELQIPEFVSAIQKRFVESLETADFTYVNMLHGILGLATETGELVDAFAQPLSEGKTFDLVNISEEVGDCQWYEARILESVGKNFEDVQLANIKKLQDKAAGRYKSGSFTETAAIVRDTTAERANLESTLS